MSRHKTTVIICALLVLSLVQACSTGIEGTRTIKMTRSEQRDTRPGAEEQLAASLRPESLDAWRPGKPFMVADAKAEVLFEYRPAADVRPADRLGAGSGIAVGNIIFYRGVASRPTPGGGTAAVVEFADSCGTFTYNTERDEASLAQLTGLDIPMLIDLDLVAQADSLLRGRQVWTLSALWYDSGLEKAAGRKFVPVTIESVMPGNMVFPLAVNFADGRGRRFSMLMNVKDSNGLGAESRTFPALFSLTDPKLKYPQISAETWQLICDSRVATGMTKEECRLALGNPSDVNAGHNWSSVLDVWGYKDGTFLQFQDGLLVNFRH